MRIAYGFRDTEFLPEDQGRLPGEGAMNHKKAVITAIFYSFTK